METTVTKKFTENNQKYLKKFREMENNIEKTKLELQT
jgi:hypothetical protein